MVALEGPGEAERSDYESTSINPPVSGIFVARGDPARAKLILCCTLPKVRKRQTAYEPKRIQAKISYQNIFSRLYNFFSILVTFHTLCTPTQVSDRITAGESHDSSSPTSKEAITHPAPLLNSLIQLAFLKQS